MENINHHQIKSKPKRAQRWILLNEFVYITKFTKNMLKVRLKVNLDCLKKKSEEKSAHEKQKTKCYGGQWMRQQIEPY